MTEVKLPSGAKLKITPAPFAEAKALYKACLEELKSLRMDPQADIDVNLLKDLFCAGFSSMKIEAALNACMDRVLYDDKKITDDTWEPVEARQDYLLACYEVTRENVYPFMKGLYAQYAPALEMLKKLVLA